MKVAKVGLAGLCATGKDTRFAVRDGVTVTSGILEGNGARTGTIGRGTAFSGRGNDAGCGRRSVISSGFDLGDVNDGVERPLFKEARALLDRDRMGGGEFRMDSGLEDMLGFRRTLLA